MAALLEAILRPGPPFDSPIRRLTFHESLDAERFADVPWRPPMQPLRLVGVWGADGLLVTVHSIRLVQQSAEMIVSATTAGQKLLDANAAVIAMDASGVRLPVLKDVALDSSSAQ